jgi:hypothetical protein
MRTLDEMNGIHKNKVCFVIGSGPSIHFQNLAPLSEYITIAVNSGYSAFPQSDYFLSDDWSVSRWSYFYKDLKESEITIALLYEDMLKDWVGLFGNRSVLFRHRVKYHITDKYAHNEYDNHICQSRTSLGSAIHVAHIMGCSPVILLGVDLCRISGCRYFWQFPYGDKHANYRKPFRNDGIPSDKYRHRRVQGIETDSDLMEIRRYWEDQTLEMRRKIDIHNASPNTVLDIFPKINLREFIKDNTEGKKNV